MMKELLARVEAATGPDLEVDAALACALDGFWAQLTPWPRGMFRVDFCYRDADGGRVSPGYGGLQCVEPYTASLDTALALVERVLPGWVWSVGNLASGGGQSYLMRGQGAELIGAKAATPALAVLAVMLAALDPQKAT